MLRDDAALQGVTLLPRHRAHVQRVRGLLVHRLLQLPAIDKLNVGDGYSSGLAASLSLSPRRKAARTAGKSSSSAAAARLGRSAVKNIFQKLRLAPAESDHRRVLAVLQYLEAR